MRTKLYFILRWYLLVCHLDCISKKRYAHPFCYRSLTKVSVVAFSFSPCNTYFQLLSLSFDCRLRHGVQTYRQTISSRNSTFSQQVCNSRELSCRTKDWIEAARKTNEESRRKRRKGNRDSQSRSNTVSHRIALYNREREGGDIDRWIEEWPREWLYHLSI